MFPFLQKLVANKYQDCIEHKNFVIHALNRLGCDILRKFHHKSSPFKGRSLSRAPTALIPLPFNNRSCPSVTDRGLKGQHQGSDCHTNRCKAHLKTEAVSEWLCLKCDLCVSPSCVFSIPALGHACPYFLRQTSWSDNSTVHTHSRPDWNRRKSVRSPRHKPGEAVI